MLKAVKTIDKKKDLLEKICDSILLVLTKWHEHSDEQFNQRPFFKLILNLIYDINRQEYKFEKNNVIEMFAVLSNKLFYKLSPLDYPGFSYAWLELISNRYFVP